MVLYRRKPTIVDAVQFTDFDNPPRGVEFHGRLAVVQHSVTTIQGRSVPVSVGEWIVAEPDGLHFYPVEAEQFAAVYESVTAITTKTGKPDMPQATDRTAQTEPLTPGQQIVAWWETTTAASEPADLADRIDAALDDALRRGQLSTLPD